MCEKYVRVNAACLKKQVINLRIYSKTVAEMSRLVTKPTKWHVPPTKTLIRLGGSDQPGHLPSLIRVFAVHMKKAWVLGYPLSAQQRLIRLGGCPGWSEASLGAHVILLVLSWGCSNVLAYRMALQRRFKLYLGTECGEYVNNPNIHLTVILNNWTSFGLSNLSILQKKLSRLVTKPTK